MTCVFVNSMVAVAIKSNFELQNVSEENIIVNDE